MTTEIHPSIIAMENKSTYFYFSYGSNMLKERIQINDANAKPYAAARLDVMFTIQFIRIVINFFFLRIIG